MYWSAFILIVFLGIIQGFIYDKRNILKYNVKNLNERVVGLYSKKFPWLDLIDEDDGNNDENNNEYITDEVIQWDSSDRNNMQSLVNQKFKSSQFPENDLVELTGQQINLIAKTWYTHVLSELFDDNKQIDNLEKMGKLKKRTSVACFFHNMNKFESTYHKNEKYRYYVWIPDKINSKRESEILVCFSLKEKDENISLYSLLINPMWTSDNISLKCLKDSISAFKLDNKTIDINDFYEDEKNERIILEWIF